MASAKKHPGRKRRIGGWVLLSLAVLVAGVWGASGWWYLNYSGDERYLMIKCGDMNYIKYPAPQRGYRGLGWHMKSTMVMEGRRPIFHLGNFHAGASPHYPLDMTVSFWPLPLLLTAAGVPVLRSGVRARRRALAGSCPVCGYDRRGLALGAVCPECGKGRESRPKA